jgi:cystathionine beta-lyase
MLVLGMYNFNKKIYRKSKSLKYDDLINVFGDDRVSALWVADMDIQTPRFITKSIIKRAKHKIYGYEKTLNKSYSCIKNWQYSQYNWKMKNKNIVITSGIRASISSAIEAYSNINDSVITFTPVWNQFFDCVLRNNRKLIKVELEKNQNSYDINFKLFEKAIKKDTKILLLCSPHNPIGKVWSKKELLKIGNICLKYGIKIISDEVYSDLSFQKFIPIASVSKKISKITITLNSPNKAFNIAGLNLAYAIVEDKIMFEDFLKIANKRYITDITIFSHRALIASYSDLGKEWLIEVKNYLKKNIRYSEKYLSKNIPNIKYKKTNASYLLWLDFTSFDLTHEEIEYILINRCRIGLSSGNNFDTKTGNKHFRMNLAIPFKEVKRVLKRLFRYNSKI